MTSREFCYWLQGHFEIGNGNNLAPSQVECIRKHLSLVFKHEIDPSYGGPQVQQELNTIHNGPPKPINCAALTDVNPNSPFSIENRPPYNSENSPKARC